MFEGIGWGEREENGYTRKLSLRGTVTVHQKVLLNPELLATKKRRGR